MEVEVNWVLRSLGFGVKELMLIQEPDDEECKGTPAPPSPPPSLPHPRNARHRKPCWWFGALNPKPYTLNPKISRNPKP